MNAVAGAATPRPAAAVWSILVVVAAVCVACWPTMSVISGKWAPISENVMSHAWLVVAVVAWGVWSEARWFVAERAGANGTLSALLPLLLTAGLSLAWALTRNAALLVPQQLLWLALLFAALWSTLGSAAMRALLRPLWILVLLMPIWTLPHAFLWFASAKAVKAMLAIVGVPAYFEGNTIHLVSGVIEIAAGCAGLAFFTAALAVAAIIGYMNRATLRQQLVLLVSAGLLAMFCNWLRIAIIVFEAHRTQMQTYLITTDHYVFGWVLFAIGLMGYCFLFGRYGLKPDATRESVPAVLTPLQLLLACACAAVGPAAIALSAGAPARQVLAVPTTAPAGFAFTTAEKALWYPRFPGPDASEIMQRDRDPAAAFVYANVFLSQDNERRLIGEGHSVLPGEHWTQLSSTPAADYADVLAEDPANAHWLIRYSYLSPHWATANALRAQLRHGWERFFSAAPLGVLAVAIPCTADCGSAERAALEADWSASRSWYAASFAPAHE